MGELSDVALILEREGRSTATLNTGAMLFNYRYAQHLMGNWFGSAKDISRYCPMKECPPCHPDRWPHEQGCLEGLLGMQTASSRRPGVKSFPGVNAHVGVVAPGTMNGPYGHYVRHLWGGYGGRYMQQGVWDEQLRRLGLLSVT